MSLDATTYMDYLPLHKKNEQHKIVQYLCPSNDESATKNDINKNMVYMASCKPCSRWENSERKQEKDKSIDLTEDSEEVAI